MSIRFKTKDKTIDVRELPDGRACIHFLFADEKGLVTTVGGINTPKEGQAGRPTLDTTTHKKWRVACNPKQNTINPQNRNGVTYMCISSQDVRAVTCPACRETPEAMDAIDKITNQELDYITKGRKAQEEAEANHKAAVTKAPEFIESVVDFSPKKPPMPGKVTGIKG